VRQLDGDGQRLKLKDKDGNAISGLGGGSGENHRLFPTSQAAPTKDASPRFNPRPVGMGGDVDYGSSTINLPYDPEAANGDAIVYSAGGGTVIGGLVDGGEYYVGDKSGNSLRLYSKDPNTGTLTLVNLTDPGSSGGRSHSLVPSGKSPAATPVPTARA
jgi:hypothetical protein